MQHWQTFKELLVCVVVVAMIGATLGIFIMKDQQSMRIKNYASYTPLTGIYEIEKWSGDTMRAPEIKAVTVAGKEIQRKGYPAHVQKLTPIATR